MKPPKPTALGFFKTKSQLLLGYPTALVVSDLQGHLRTMIFFISSERTYANSY